MEKPTFHFKDPKKKFVRGDYEVSPLPVPIGVTAGCGIWSYFVGHLVGDSVVVDQSSEMDSLYAMGFFGKGNLSRSHPQYNSEKILTNDGHLPAVRHISKRRYFMHVKWAKQLDLSGMMDNFSQEEDVLPYKKKQKLANSSETTHKILNAKETQVVNDPVPVNEVVLFDQKVDVVDPDPWLTTDVAATEAFWGCDNPGYSDNNTDINLTAAEDINNVTNATCSSSAQVSEQKQSSLCTVDEDLTNRDDDDELVAAADLGEDLLTSVNDVDSSCRNEGVVPNVNDFKSDCEEQYCQNKVCVVDDTEDSDIDEEELAARPKWHTVLADDHYPLLEHLVLTLEEAYFLSYGVGCLTVQDINNRGPPMNLTEMWRTFCSICAEFPFRYGVYHYYRSKGWIPKPGLKFGVDFLLYKRGPAFYHASYSVIMKIVKASNLNISSGSSLASNWTSLSCLNRVTEQVSKELLLCYVVIPDELDVVASPECIAQFKISEVVIRRWISKKERENSEHFLIP